MTPVRRVALALALVLSAGLTACSDDAERPPVGESAASATTTTSAPATTASVPPGGRQPTAEDKLRVLLAGDSVMAGLAPAVATALNEGGQTEAMFALTPSIARDTATRVLWQNQLEDFDPDLVVMLIGVWERGSGDFEPGDPGWAPTYAADVLDPFAELVTSQGAQLLWIGMPAVEEPGATLQFVALNTEYRALAERNDSVEYLEGGDFLNGPNGSYTDRLPDAAGTLQRVRRTDGLHLCPAGSERLAIPVLEYVQQQWNVDIGFGWQNGPWREPPTLDKPEECPPIG
jgi:hypothetical protein